MIIASLDEHIKEDNIVKESYKKERYIVAYRKSDKWIKDLGNFPKNFKIYPWSFYYGEMTRANTEANRLTNCPFKFKTIKEAVDIISKFKDFVKTSYGEDRCGGKNIAEVILDPNTEWKIIKISEELISSYKDVTDDAINCTLYFNE